MPAPWIAPCLILLLTIIVADKGGARAVTVPLPYAPGSIPIAVVACSAPVALRKTILSLSRAEGFMVKQLYVFQDAPELFPQVTSALNRLVDLDGLLLREQWYTHDHDRRPTWEHMLFRLPPANLDASAALQISIDLPSMCWRCCCPQSSQTVPKLRQVLLTQLAGLHTCWAVAITLRS